jgi:NADPH:quinone reductase-like Zn-dependent oxidoreductase
MRATVFEAFGPPEVLVQREVATPAIGPDEVLVRVAVTSVGRHLDLNARAGTHPYDGFKLPHILGAEHAGTVVQVGSEVTSAGVGDRVAVFPVITCGRCQPCLTGRPEGCEPQQIIGIHRAGGYAEYAAVPAPNVRVMPPGLGIDPAAAAALALAGPVAMNQLTQAGMSAGDWVLVQGAASALGSLTAALAVHLGARVIGTSRSAAKRKVLEAMGVEATLDPAAEDFTDRVLSLTGGHGVSLAVDDLGEPKIFAATMASLATLGTVVSSGAFLSGQAGVGLDLRRLYLRSQRVIGVRTGTQASADALWREAASGFRPVIDRAFPLADACHAHSYLEEDSNVGRVVLYVEA